DQQLFHGVLLWSRQSSIPVFSQDQQILTDIPQMTQVPGVRVGLPGFHSQSISRRDQRVSKLERCRRVEGKFGRLLLGGPAPITVPHSRGTPAAAERWPRPWRKTLVQRPVGAARFSKVRSLMCWSRPHRFTWSKTSANSCFEIGSYTKRSPRPK